MMISNMRHAKAEPIWIIDQPIDIHSAVEELHGLGSQELNKLLRDSENFTLQRCSENGSKIQIDIERLARCLPVHLIAVLVSSGGDEAHLLYLLRGFWLLHSFHDLASRNTKLEQILLEDVRAMEQIMDLLFYTIVLLARYKQVIYAVGLFPLLHAALVACSLHLLAGYISSQWKDLAQVLVAHPEVDLFMDAAFNALRIDIMFLQNKLSTLKTDTSSNNSDSIYGEVAAHNLCQQSEASLQFLQSLCQQKLFRERLLKNKELCKNGGILSLVQAVLNLDTQHLKEAFKVAAAVSRMKSKVLSILLQLCETESISYLDEVASSPRSMQLAKSVALEVLKLLKNAFGRKQNLKDRGEGSFPRGLVLLNTMRLADIFSDDSNFRYFITVNTTHVLAEMLLLRHEEFLTSWCSADLPVVEEDATLEYDPFVATGVVLILLSAGLKTSNETNTECTFNLNSLSEASYAQHRTSLLVKIIANLHCFVPNICEEEERNLFFNKFLECLRMELPTSPSTSYAQNETTVRKNLGSLLDYASSLVPTFLNEEDVQLLRKFYQELQSSLASKIEDNSAKEKYQDKKYKRSFGSDKSLIDAGECKQETQSGGHVDANDDRRKEGTSESIVAVSSSSRRNEKAETSAASESLQDPHNNVETSGSEASSIRVKDNGEFPKLKEVEENDKSDERQRRKRKRNIMNDKQITLIEQALLDEPEMQRHAGLLQSWADKLSVHGSELTPSQLKNWLNNRKAKLARVAKETPRDRDRDHPDKSGGGGQGNNNFYSDSPESPSSSSMLHISSMSLKCVGFEAGQCVCLLDKERNEIGKGKVFQVQGIWGDNDDDSIHLEEVGACVVDVSELQVEKKMSVQYPSESRGNTFQEAEDKNGGVIRVAWDANNIIILPH